MLMQITTHTLHLNLPHPLPAPACLLRAALLLRHQAGLCMRSRMTWQAAGQQRAARGAAGWVLAAGSWPGEACAAALLPGAVPLACVRAWVHGRRRQACC